jgi:SAM-dependent methyltransferase
MGIGLSLCCTPVSAPDVQRVAKYFSQPAGYLTRREMVLIRRRIFAHWLAERSFSSIIDIGCGDGTLSIPFAGPNTGLTLLDLTAFMLQTALANVPSGLRNNVTLIESDFASADLPAGAYDLVLLVGVLAHMSQPAEAIAKAASLVRPGGVCLSQVSDAHHPVGWAWRAYMATKGLLRRQEHRLNNLSGDWVIRQFCGEGLELVDEYRYNLSAPGLARLLSSQTLARLTRMIHGDPGSNRLHRLGAERLLMLRRPA